MIQTLRRPTDGRSPNTLTFVPASRPVTPLGYFTLAPTLTCVFLGRNSNFHLIQGLPRFGRKFESSRCPSPVGRRGFAGRSRREVLSCQRTVFRCVILGPAAPVSSVRETFFRFFFRGCFPCRALPRFPIPRAFTHQRVNCSRSFASRCRVCVRSEDEF